MTVELERLRSLLAAVEAQVAVEVEATEAAKTPGWVSPGDWLTHTAGGRHGHGSRLLRTARPLCGDRAATLVALQAGEVSPEHAEVIVAVIDRLPGQPSLREEAERMLLDQAASLNASELRKAGDHLLEVLDPDGTARADEAALDRLERSAHLGRFLTLTEDGIGGVRVRGRGTVEDAALIKNALHALAAPRPGTDPDCGETARDLRDHGARTWDALVETCLKASEVDGLLPEQHGAKPRLTVTVTLDQLRPGSVPRPWTPATSSPPPRSGGSPATPRSSPPSSAPWVRSSTSAAPNAWSPPRSGKPSPCATGTAASPAAAGCHWPATPTTCSTGPTADRPSLDNLVLLCRAHHTLLHATPWQVRLNPLDRRPEFRRPPRRRTDPPDDHWIRALPARGEFRDASFRDS